MERTFNEKELKDLQNEKMKLFDSLFALQKLHLKGFEIAIKIIDKFGEPIEPPLAE
jgi:hypothetical protein